MHSGVRVLELEGREAAVRDEELVVGGGGDFGRAVEGGKRAFAVLFVEGGEVVGERLEGEAGGGAVGADVDVVAY